LSVNKNIKLSRMMTQGSGPKVIIKGTTMSIIKDGIEYGLSSKKRGFYLSHLFSNKDFQILSAITERQKKKFKNKKLIPFPLIQFLWELDFLPVMRKPTEGIRVPAFLNLLSHGEYKDKRHQYKGIWLRDQIEAEEYPETIINHEIYLKVLGDRHRRTPASYFRDIPGTIIR